ncbi:MAG: 3-hydroxylacyl-ACP dehydratase [Arenicella sp.]
MNDSAPQPGIEGEARFEPELFELIPHRPPMLLINDIVSVDATCSSALVRIDELASFYTAELGVPVWIGIEYMGQTAALIAGYQLKQGLMEPHLGFLLGTRRYNTEVEYFAPGSVLLVECSEKALVGDDLATFACTIRYNGSDEVLAEASLSVFRKPPEVAENSVSEHE